MTDSFRVPFILLHSLAVEVEWVNRSWIVLGQDIGSCWWSQSGMEVLVAWLHFSWSLQRPHVWVFQVKPAGNLCGVSCGSPPGRSGVDQMDGSGREQSEGSRMGSIAGAGWEPVDGFVKGSHRINWQCQVRSGIKPLEGLHWWSQL